LEKLPPDWQASSPNTIATISFDEIRIFGQVGTRATPTGSELPYGPTLRMRRRALEESMLTKAARVALQRLLGEFFRSRSIVECECLACP
jgi:hypothetical protein